jgi:hypothetical protein
MNIAYPAAEFESDVAAIEGNRAIGTACLTGRQASKLRR